MRRVSSTLVLGTQGIQEIPPKAHVVKLVNTLHSGCSERTLLEVRVFSWARYKESTGHSASAFLLLQYHLLRSDGVASQPEDVDAFL